MSSQVERRAGTRLEVDDPYHCKRCGWELPVMMVDGPIAGGETEYEAVELCGRCKGKHFNKLLNLQKGLGYVEDSKVIR